MSDGGVQEAMMMEQFSLDTVIREQLIERKEKLKEAMALGGDFEFANLLGEVEHALKKIDNGTFGKCERCSGEVEPERLLSDPLTRVCLGELTESELRSLESDLELASIIQRGLLPKMSFSGSGWKADFVYEPHGIVSGDYCDIIPAGDDVYFVLGDVSGKGMAASLLMSNLHAIFRSLVPTGLAPVELVSRANHLLAESSPSNQFATLVCVKASNDGDLEVVNAGHLPPVLIKNEMKGVLDFSGLPIGMFADAKFSSTRVQLKQGDSLVMFTDGVTEALDPHGTEFGISNLMEAIQCNGLIEPGNLLGRCLEKVTAHRGSASRFDDLSMLAVTFDNQSL